MEEDYLRWLTEENERLVEEVRDLRAELARLRSAHSPRRRLRARSRQRELALSSGSSGRS